MTASVRSGSEKLGRPLVHSWEVVDGVTGRVVVRKFGYVEAFVFLDYGILLVGLVGGGVVCGVAPVVLLLVPHFLRVDGCGGCGSLDIEDGPLAELENDGAMYWWLRIAVSMSLLVTVGSGPASVIAQSTGSSYSLKASSYAQS